MNTVDTPFFAGDVLADFRLVKFRPAERTDKAWSAWEATDLMLGRRVALKILRRDHALVESCRTLEKDLERGVWVPHPGLVRLYGVREDDDWIAIAEALIERERTVFEVFRESSEMSRALLDRRIAVVFAKVAEALDVAHKVGVAHGALSPGNVLVTVDGLPKVSDVGLHGLVVPDFQLERIAASPYASPEQFLAMQRCEWVVSPHADQFSLGVLLHCVLAGRHPFASGRGAPRASAALVRERRRLSRATPLDEVCHRALEPDPRDRYPDLAAFADDLLAAVDGAQLQARRPSMVGRLVRMARRWKHQIPSTSPTEDANRE